MRWILNFRVFIIISMAVMLISVAVLFSVLRAFLPHATGYKNEIQQEVSKQIGLPVEIDTIDAAIHWFSPRLKLIDVSVYDNNNEAALFEFKEAFVELDVITSLLRGEFIIDDVGLIGADLSIEKLSENEWLVQGIKLSSEGPSELPDRFLYMLQNADYLLHDSNIYYQDHTGDKLKLDLLDVNIDVRNNFNNHDIKLSMNLPEDYGRDIAVVANLQGDIASLSGDIYVEANQINIKQWNQKFKLLNSYQLNAVLDVNLWGEVKDNNIQSLIAQFVAEKVQVKNTLTAKSWKTNYLSSNFRYVYDEKHWHLSVSDFYFGEKLKPAWDKPVDVLLRDSAAYYYLSADFLRISDVRAVADVFLTKEQLSDLVELDSYQIKSDIYNLNLQLPKDMTEQVMLDELFVEAEINDFSFSDNKNKIKLSGVDLSLKYEHKNAVLDVQSENTKVELKDLFKKPLFAESIQGQLTLDYAGSNWLLKTQQLQLKNKHINTFSRLDVQLTAENDVFVDVQTDFYDADGRAVKHYLPAGIMSKPLLDWLNMAVTDGFVPEGKFILHGKLADFPYENNSGVFQVLFSPENVNMRYLENWPLLSNTSATLKFNNSSLVVNNASAKTQGISLYKGFVEIKDLTEPHLTVITRGRGNTKDAQSYVWNSPLDEVLGDSLRLFTFDGKSDLKLKIEVPLDNDDAELAINGSLKFIDTGIHYTALGYDISAINGVLDFTKDSISSDSMQAVIQKNPVTINAFTRMGKSGSEVVFQLDGLIGADYLLQQFDWLPESWVSGQSAWAIDIGIPYQPKDHLVQIKTSSYLEDIVLQVSDKVNKAAASKTHLTAEIDVLKNNGLRVEVNRVVDKTIVDETGGDGTEDGATDVKESAFELYATRDQDYMWRFNIKSEYMTGKGEFIEGMGRDTHVKLDLDYIDIHALFYNENSDSNNSNNIASLDPADFPLLNWKFKKARWQDWKLSDVVLKTDGHEHGVLINTFSLKGPAMAFDARGTWLTSWRNAHETVMQGTLSGSNCGTTLAGLGFQRSIDHCKYKAKFDARWPTVPYGLSWANMKGKTSFEMKEGEILEVEPGAGGRLLGLLNIFELPKRLSLDFDDVTRKGFAFDYIKGDFEFVNGDGLLNSFVVSAPAADISMYGSVGLINRDYDLLMRVKPHTDTLTFAGGALLGGVAVGAGLALIQKMLDIGIIGQDVYSITGSWDDPKIEELVQSTPESDTADEDEF